MKAAARKLENNPGDPLSAPEVLKALTEEGVKLTRKGTTLLAGPESALTARLKALIQAHKEDLLTLLEEQPDAGAALCGFTRQQLLELAHPNERADLLSIPGLLEAFAWSLSKTGMRERPWSEGNGSRPGERFAGRAPVWCPDCTHWKANEHNPIAGIGRCAIDTRKRVAWPLVPVTCTNFQQEAKT